MPFNVQGALDSGYSYSDIAEELARSSKFDLERARKHYKDPEIVRFLSTGKTFDVSSGSGVGGAITTVGKGIVKGLSEFAAFGAEQGAKRISPKTPIGKVERLIFGEPKEGGPKPGEAIRELPIKKGLTYESRESLPPEMRPFAVGGEVIGESLPFAISGTGIVARLFGTAKKAIALAEAGSIAGSAQAGAIAEALDPGDDVTRVIAEVVGSFVNPTTLPIRATKVGTGVIKRWVSSLSPSGRKQAAAAYVKRVLEDFKEDPDKVVLALRAADDSGLRIPQSAGPKSSSPALLAIEAKLAGSPTTKGREFRIARQEESKNTLIHMREAVSQLQATGDPDALRMAALVRDRYIKELVSERVRVATTKASEMNARVSTDITAKGVSYEVAKVVDDAYKDLKVAETAAWKAIPSLFVTRTNTLTAYAKARKGMLPDDNFGPVIEGFIKRLKKGGSVTTKQLDMLRKELGEQATRIGGNKGRLMRDVANGVLDDISTVAQPQIQEAIATSRNINAAFHDTYLDAFIGGKIPPEALIERAFGAGKTTADIRFREMWRAVGLSGDKIKPLLESQEDFLRLIASKTIDSSTGLVNPAKLSRFIEANSEILKNFPDLQRALSSAASAQRNLESVVALTNRFTSRTKKIDAFARLVGNENPARAIQDVLSSRNPVAGFTSLVRLARRSGPGATAGLRASAFNHAVDKAQGSGGFNWQKFTSALVDPIREGQPSLLQMMKQKGVITGRQVKSLEAILKKADESQALLIQRQAVGGEIIETPDVVSDLIIRISGSGVGTRAARVFGAQSIIAAQAGSQAARKLLQQIPATRTIDALYEAFENPQLMADLIELGKDLPTTGRGAISAALQVVRDARLTRVHSVLLQAGLIPESE